MGYVGNQTTNSYTSMDKQTITGNGGTSYTLDHAVANVNEIEVFVNNVRQEPSVAYTVAGTALTMTGNVASSDDFYVVFQGKALQTVVPPDGSVTSAKLASGVVASNLGTSVNLATIKDSTGTNTAMTIDSSGSIAMDNTYSMLHLSLLSDHTSDGVLTSWGSPQQSKQLSTFGNNPATHSSGVFTFAKTGVYRIMFSCRMLHQGGDTSVTIAGEASYDNGSTFVSHVRASEGNASGGTSTGAITLLDFFNVDNITNCKYRFKASSVSGSSQIYGASSNLAQTVCSFERIADVQ